MNLWKVICATLVIFITGVVTGGLLVSYADRVSQKNRRPFQHENVRLPANVPNPGPGINPRDPARLPNPANLPNRQRAGISLEFLQKLHAEIQLTPGQRERIEQIVTEGQQNNKAIWDRVAPEIRRENLETQRRIREALLPEQLARFEELMKQNRPAGRRLDESLPPNSRPREQRRPLPSRDAQENPQPVPQPNP